MIKHLTIITRQLLTYQYVLRQLVSQQIVLRYRRTILGYLWTLVNPLMMMSIMAVVFSTLFKADLVTFAIFLFAGMIPWNFFNSMVAQSSTSFIQNEGLIKKIYIPKIVFPFSTAVALIIDSMLSFVALFIIILAIGGPLSWAVLFLPISFLLLFIFSLGVGLTVSILTVFFRDLQYVVGIALQGLFFLTPVLYKPESLGGRVAWIIQINPIVPFIDLFRTPLYLGHLPSVQTISSACLFAFFSLGIGLLIFIKQEKSIVFRL